MLKSIGRNVSSATVRDSCGAADVVVLATPWPAAQDVIEAAGDLKGKIVVDCSNPIAEDMKGLSTGLTTSAAERVADLAKGARVVKCFNTTGVQNMIDPVYGSQSITMFLCGDNAEAREVVAQLAHDLGFEVCDAGPLYAARFLEPMAMLWVHLAYVQALGPGFAFKILKR